MTAIVCPACRKTNQEPPACLRCGADLSLLWKAQAAAEAALLRAERALRQGDFAGAQDQARRSWRLKHSRAAARVLFLSLVSLGEFERGHAWFRRL